MLFAQHTNLNMMKLAQFGLCLICLFVGEMGELCFCVPASLSYCTVSSHGVASNEYAESITKFSISREMV